MNTVTCSRCGEDEENPQRYGEKCPNCAGKGTHPKHLYAKWSWQHYTWCVVVDDYTRANVDELIEWAGLIGAKLILDELDYYVVEFARNGQQLYREFELRFSLAA